MLDKDFHKRKKQNWMPFPKLFFFNKNVMFFSRPTKSNITLHLSGYTEAHTRACAFCFSLHLDQQRLAEASLPA